MFAQNKFRGCPALLTLVVVMAACGSPRHARAGLWDWLFPSRNHSYYAGSQPTQPQGAMSQSMGYPAAQSPQASWNPSVYGGTQQPQSFAATPQAVPGYASPQAAQPSWPSSSPQTATGYPPNQVTQNDGAQAYANQGYGNPGFGTQASGATQQLTNPLVIIPSSSAPISGVAPATAMSANDGPSAPQVQSSVVQSGFTSSGMVTSGFAPANSAVVTSQPQQVFMLNQGAQLNSCATCLPGSARRTASYRTVWYRVPTTNFRPVAAVDPCSGAQTTVMRPCTTFSWQARRVPTMRSPSLCERLFGCFKRPPPPTIPVAPMAMSANYVCGPTCTTVPAASSTAPYYSPPTTVAPANSTYPLGGTSLPATGYPSGAYPTTGGTMPGGAPAAGTVPSGVSPPLREPADQRPSLSPGPRRYAPEDDPWRGDTPPEQDADAASESSASYAPSDDNPPPLHSFQPGNSNTAPSIRSSHDRADPRRRDPQPVPDPDAVLNPQQRFEPPRLLNPKDRRASQATHRAGDYVLASWPDTARTSDRANSTITPPSAKAKARHTDPAPIRPATQIQTPAHDSGWRSIPR